MVNDKVSSPWVDHSNFEGNFADSGGGMCNLAPAVPLIYKCEFKHNGAVSDGGAMYNCGLGSPTPSDCVFSNNSASRGGEVCNDESTRPWISHCSFRENTADSGGAMYNGQSTEPSVSHCDVRRNTADSGGGMYNGSTSRPRITTCEFEGNVAALYGGGMNNDGSSPVVTACRFTGNEAHRGGGMGNDGGSSPLVINCLLLSNQGHDAGGGVYNVSDPANHPELINCTFRDNAASRSGGMYNGSGSIAEVTNCILWGDTPDEIGGTGIGTVHVTYSDIENGGSWLVAGSYNIVSNPLFRDYYPASLAVGSPCIDAGNNSAVPATVTTDFEGAPRFVDDPGTADTGSGTLPIVDMGACEFQ